MPYDTGRHRISNPGRYQAGSFRTIDPGKPGGPKLVIARPKGKTTTEVQSVLGSGKIAQSIATRLRNRRKAK